MTSQKRYVIECQADAVVRERWAIMADSANDAREMFEDDTNGQRAEFIDQETSDEEGRFVVGVTQEDAPAAAADEPGLSVEVSAVRFTTGEAETCNDDPATAQGFAIYIRNPLAFHIQDVTPEGWNGGERITMREAHGAAFRYAHALASHLGCVVVSQLDAAAEFWPSRFVVEGQCDLNADLAPESEGTRFEACDDATATQWAVLKLETDAHGAPIAHSGDLVEDYPTRAAAEAAVKALEQGMPLPDPEWPNDDDENPPAAVIVDALEMLDCVTFSDREGDNAGRFTVTNDAGETQRYRFTVLPD